MRATTISFAVFLVGIRYPMEHEGGTEKVEVEEGQRWRMLAGREIICVWETPFYNLHF